MEPDGDRPVAFHCVVGHEIPEAELAAATEVVRLDAGAEVRICREHGAPIALCVAPARQDVAGVDHGRHIVGEGTRAATDAR